MKGDDLSMFIAFPVGQGLISSVQIFYSPEHRSFQTARLRDVAFDRISSAEINREKANLMKVTAAIG
jgi:hypothetical protein